MRRPPEFVPLGRTERPPRSVWLAPLSVVLGSLVTIVPMVATIPILPPFGLMMLLGWRLHRADSMRVWAPAPLGLFDDIVSGQPIGSGMLLWTLCFLAIDVIDTRLVWRNFWQNWLIAAGTMGGVLTLTRFVAAPFGAHVDTALLLQIFVSAALFPVAARFCAALDRDARET